MHEHMYMYVYIECSLWRNQRVNEKSSESSVSVPLYFNSDEVLVGVVQCVVDNLYYSVIQTDLNT